MVPGLVPGLVPGPVPGLVPGLGSAAIEMARGPLMRIRARAETPGGVEQAAMVSFSKATGITQWQISEPLGESYLWCQV
jgi:hypothetical protein